MFAITHSQVRLLVLLLLGCVGAPLRAQQASKLVDTQPPVAALDVPFQTLHLDPRTCTPLVFYGGSTVCIPANALEDAQGRPPACTQVEVRYRELHTPLDMMLSGVVMRARLPNTAAHPNGQEALLESAGMFQLEVYCNGTPLRLKRGQQARVWMRTENPLAAPQLFAYDARQKRWNLLPNAAVNQVVTGDPTPAPNPELFGEFARANPDSPELNRGNQDWDVEGDGFGDGFEGPVDTLRRETFYAMGVDSLGLYNVDMFLDNSAFVPINANIELEGVPSPGHYHLYLVFEGVNTVLWIPDLELNLFRMYANKRYRMVCLYGDQVAVFDPANLPPSKVATYRNRPFTFRLKPLPAATLRNRAALAEALRIR